MDKLFEVNVQSKAEKSLGDMNHSNLNALSHFGFRLGYGSAHTARTIMLEDLRKLFKSVGNPSSLKAEYIESIVVDNCLGKRSVKTRVLTSRHLLYLYSLDPSITIFRALRYFWDRDVESQPLLALLCSVCRDSLLRLSTSFILKFSEGESVERETLEAFIEAKEPGRFSNATLESTAQNLNSSWTKSGHLSGKAVKIRSRALATPGSVSYALFLGYLMGVRGETLFFSEYTRLLDCSPAYSIELAETASRRGWIVFKRIGNVMEVQFPNLLTAQERELIHE